MSSPVVNKCWHFAFWEFDGWDESITTLFRMTQLWRATLVLAVGVSRVSTTPRDFVPFFGQQVPQDQKHVQHVLQVHHIPTMPTMSIMSTKPIMSTMSTMSSSRCSRTGSSGAWWTRSPSTLWTSSCRRGRRGRLGKTCWLCWLLNAAGLTKFVDYYTSQGLDNSVSSIPFSAVASSYAGGKRWALIH